MELKDKVLETVDQLSERFAENEQFKKNTQFVEDMQRAGVMRKIDYNIPLMDVKSACFLEKKVRF